MAIEFSWHLEGKVAYARLHNDVVTDDLLIGNRTVTKWINETDAGQFHVIFDCTDMTGIRISPLESMRTLRYLNHEKMGGFVLFGAPRYLTSMINVFGGIISRLTNATFFTGDTLDSVLYFLDGIDPTLNLTDPDTHGIDRNI